MHMLARGPSRLASRFVYGTAAYWALNVVLVATEIRWHLLYRLTAWDISQFKSLGPLIYQLVHGHIAG